MRQCSHDEVHRTCDDCGEVLDNLKVKPLTKKEENKLNEIWDNIPDDLVEDIGLLVDLEIRNQ